MPTDVFDSIPRGGPVAVAPAAAPAARTLLDIFEATASRCGESVAIEAADVALTYSELADAVSELAAELRARGIGPGDRVGVRVPSGTAELYIAILGVLAAGAAYVPVDADDPAERAATIWERAEACAVIEAELAIRELAPPRGEARDAGVNDDAWVIFTSGSSGEPKGVAISHRSAAAFVDAETRLWSVGSDDRVLAGLSVSCDASCEEMWLAWGTGAALVAAPRAIVRSGADLGPWLAERDVTVISTVPTLAAMWDEGVIDGVRLLILGGEACPEELGWRLATGREVWNTYGPTETTVVATAALIRPYEPVTIGEPLDGWQVAVVDERSEPVPFGEAGELVIGGVGLGRYIDPALDAERFAALEALGWERAYRSGDIVRETVLGLEFVGRRDDQVKIGARRIELGEVDAQLRSAPGVRAAATTVRKTASGNSVLAGYVTGDVDPAAVRAHVAERLPAAVVPLVVVLDELPTTTSGKVDRKALPWPPPRAAAAGAERAALSETAAWLADRWEDQLGPLPITADSDFFELGGSSLAAAKLVSALRERFPAVAVADVYNHRRLGEFAERLDRLGATSESRAPAGATGRRGWGALELVGVLLITALMAPDWLLAIFSVNHAEGTGVGHAIGWGWLVAGWLALVSAPGRATLVLIARRALLGRLKAGRYPRHSWLAVRVAFLDRLAEVAKLNTLAGTPFAPAYARISGARVGKDVRLGTLPPPTALISIGDRATIEGDVDLHGWWFDGDELVVGEMRIGARARVGARSLLMPGSDVGAGAEVEPGSVVTGTIPAGERWSGSPARYDGRAGENWPAEPGPRARTRWAWQARAMFGAGLLAQNLLVLGAAIPDAALLEALGPKHLTLASTATTLLTYAPLFAVCFLVSYALLVVVVVRSLWPLVRPG